MKNLLNFIIKYAFTLVFILIEILCFVLIFTQNSYHRFSFVNSSNRITATISQRWNSVVEYTKLKSINDSLALENERLMNNLEKYRKYEIPAIERSGYQYISAKIVSSTVNRNQNYITIDKGRNHGIEPEMGVIGPNGIVGIVVSTSNKYSTILPVINLNSKISVKLEKNDYFGSLYWESQKVNQASLSEIPGYVSVQKGDIVVTSGFSAIFPDGIPVGSINSFVKNKSTDFYEITVDLFTDFNNLSYVYVIINSNRNEQLEMMPETDDE
ncbi:MAG: rod shape-determining protein MreC [Bacteroidales bacterium]|nr:rod shape-determining protein MreC [Bacteroidales bacterium]MDD3859587.1 rod shape-determining protein MreC [Bacteroidales bacterium]